MFFSIKHSLFTVATASLLSLSNLVLSLPSYGFSLDLSTWDKIGDVNPISPNQATINSTVNTVVTGGGTGSLEDFLGVTPGSLDPVSSTFGATQGSAIGKTLTGIQAGDVLRFNWNLLTSDADSAFVTINNLVIPLTISASFNYSFATKGTYNIGITVVDVDDTIGYSQLIISDARVEPVPEPATIFSSLIVLGFGVIKWRFAKKLARFSNLN